MSDTHKLQKAIDDFILWCDVNGLCVHIMKCKIITFALKRITIHTDYYIKNEVIERTHTIRDLGIMLDAKLTFSEHIEYVANKAYAMLAFVKRQSYKTFDTDIAKMLFYAFVRSHLEFACQVWSPFQTKYINAIESIQKQFVKFIHPNNSANDHTNPFKLRPYEDRCAELNLVPLLRPRINACIYFIHDILSGRVNCPRLRSQLQFFRITYFTRSPKFIKLERCKRECTDVSPFRTACRLYNLIALHIDVTLDHQSFRNRVMQLPDSLFKSFYQQNGVNT